MDNQLVTITQTTIGDEEVNAVNARDLWEALEIKKQFANWVQTQIERGDFVRDRDYAIFNFEGINTAIAGRPAVEYVLTLDTAKHLCLMSDTPKGKVIRAYFIEVEKEWRNSMVKSSGQVSAVTRRQIIMSLLDEEERLNGIIRELEHDNQCLREKLFSDGQYGVYLLPFNSISLKEAADKIGMRFEHFIVLMEWRGMIRWGKGQYVACEEAIGAGYLRRVTFEVPNKKGKCTKKTHIEVTPLGFAILKEACLKEHARLQDRMPCPRIGSTKGL